MFRSESTDPEDIAFQKAVKKAEVERRKSLKSKRKSKAQGKEWDPSGCEDQGPTVQTVGSEEAGGCPDTEWKHEKAAQKRASVVGPPKSWDPSGTEEQGPSVHFADNSVGWKGHVAEEVPEGQQADRRKSKAKRTSTIGLGIGDPSDSAAGGASEEKSGDGLFPMINEDSIEAATEGDMLPPPGPPPVMPKKGEPE